MICSRCKEDKPEEEFSIDKRWSRGRGYLCKSCLRQYHKENYEKNKEKIKLKVKQWIEDNPKKHLEHGRRYRENNVEKERLRAKIKYQKYKWRWKIYKAQRKKLEKDLCPLTKETFILLFEQQIGLCYYCGSVLEDNFHLDHKTPITRGGDNQIENLCLTCPSCNLKKHTKTEQEFKEVLECKL